MKNITEAEKYVLDLLSAANSGQPAPPLPEGLWPQVCEELASQTVIGVPADAVDSLALTQTEADDYLALVGSEMSNWYQLMMAQDTVLSAFRSADIPVAVLKGAAAALYYPNPTYRSMGDIDLIVPPAFFDQAFELMKELGWDNTIDVQTYPRHVGFEKPNCPEIELHRFFSTCSDKQQAQILDQLIYEGISSAQWQNIDIFSVPVLPPLVNGLVLLAHINQHLGSGLGFRQILDWQMFVEAHLTDDFWNNGFQQAAKQIGMEKLAVTVTALCRTYLGLQRPLTWCNDAEFQLVDDLLVFINRQGNMGRKVEHGARKTRTVLHSFHNPIALIRYLYSGGCAHWAPARKHPCLAPLACVYQVGHIIRKGLKRDIGISALTDDVRNAQAEVDLLKRLEVTRM